MFGYIVPNQSSLTDAQRIRFRSVYCGLCRALRKQHGLMGSTTLSYDLTFLALLLQSLYEPDEICGNERCPTHLLKTHPYVFSEPFEYAADMNVALAYHKCLDNWRDEKSILSKGEASLLRNAYKRVANRYPEKCAVIEQWLDEIHQIEEMPDPGIDLPVNSTGKMLGELFCYQDDCWSDSLRMIGDGLGRFIYFMDAYDDLPDDVRKNRFNPLKQIQTDKKVDFENLCRDAMTMMIADCTNEFEQLPILKDEDLLRNVLYSGVWSKYVQIQKKRNATSKGAE